MAQMRARRLLDPAVQARTRRRSVRAARSPSSSGSDRWWLRSLIHDCRQFRARPAIWSGETLPVGRDAARWLGSWGPGARPCGARIETDARLRVTVVGVRTAPPSPPPPDGPGGCPVHEHRRGERCPAGAAAGASERATAALALAADAAAVRGDCARAIRSDALAGQGACPQSLSQARLGGGGRDG
jgi:hypothetical protein